MSNINNVVKNVEPHTTVVQPWPTREEQLAKLEADGWEVVAPAIPARPRCIDPEPIGEQITVGPKYTLIGRTYRVYEAIRGGIEEAVERVKTLVTRRVSEIIPRQVNWLWPDRIARGKVSMIAGNPGLGKSQITTSIAAIVTTGRTWPDGSTAPTVGTVLILSAEDDADDTLRPRLEAAGANLTRVEIIDAVDITGKGNLRLFDLTEDLAALETRLTELGDVAVVIIDPVTAYLGETDSHRNADVRALLSPLSVIAARHDVAIIAISHLNKNIGSEAMLRVTGSLAFVASARAAYLVSQDRENKDLRLFLPMKNNVGSDRNGLAFKIEECAITGPDGPIKTSRIAWEGLVTTTANEALQEDPDRTVLQDAEDWLREYLADGPWTSGEVDAAAKKAGIKGITLRRAKKKLGVKSTKTGMDGGWVCSLPKDEEEDDQR